MRRLQQRLTVRSSTLLVALLHVPLVVVAMMMLHFGWIVQVAAMGCDTGAIACRAELRSAGEAVATVGPSAVLVASVVASIFQTRRGRESSRIPVLGLLASMLTIVAAAVTVLASTVLGP